MSEFDPLARIFMAPVRPARTPASCCRSRIWRLDLATDHGSDHFGEDGLLERGCCLARPASISLNNFPVSTFDGGDYRGSSKVVRYEEATF
jgi:hypothetical protein